MIVVGRKRRMPLQWNRIQLAIGMGVGGMLMYFFDPVRGARRRAVLAGRLVHAEHRARTVILKGTRDLDHRLHGVVAEMAARTRSDAVTDDVLVGRVRWRWAGWFRAPGTSRCSRTAGA